MRQRNLVSAFLVSLTVDVIRPSYRHLYILITFSGWRKQHQHNTLSKQQDTSEQWRRHGRGDGECPG